VAARAYNRIAAGSDSIRRVVLLGPAHRVALRGMALPTVQRFHTPLGDITLDQNLIAEIRDLPGVGFSDQAHQEEHSLEVQLPFLQTVLGEFTLVPLVVGLCSAEQVSELLQRVWNDQETLVMISSDLSHYHPYTIAQRLDSETALHIEALEGPLTGDQACGAYPLNGLLDLARRQGMRAERLDLRNSGDTAGSRDRVVGYGSWALR
jgi:MEMO1 family protein